LRCASVDIGTNTLRLLIAEASETGGIRPLLYKRHITRLGGSYTEEHGIDKDAAERTVKALEDFAIDIKKFGVGKVVNAATSVVRRAVNSPWFIDEAEKRSGIRPSVVSGDDEARLSVAGVLSVVAIGKDDTARRLIFDIGGGSTEFIITEGYRVVSAWSMELGVVHLTERYLTEELPSKQSLLELESHVRDVVVTVRGLFEKDGIDIKDFFSKEGSEIVGTAGTITTLAAIDQRLDIYDRERINRYVLGIDRVRAIYKELSAMPLSERARYLTLEKGREDLIIPGSAITIEVMEAFGFDSIRVSDAGLLEGLIIKELGLA